MPANWTLDHDEDLAQFLSDHVEVDNENLGSIKNFVESIDVSSFCVSLITVIIKFSLYKFHVYKISNPFPGKIVYYTLFLERNATFLIPFPLVTLGQCQ